MQTDALIALLREPRGVAQLRGGQWHAVVEQGRKTQMLGQLAAALAREGVMPSVPPEVRRHLDLAALTALRRQQSALWEVRAIRQAVDASIPLTLLKGGAYAAAGDTNGVGRLFSDVDLLVDRQHLAATEAALFGAGWKPGRVSAYDAAYYRNWMHEVPPMEHVRRHTVVDLHHAINPPISRLHVDPQLLFERVVGVQPGVFVLCAADRVVHCSLHLLQEGEPKKLLRDLYDLHLLLQQHFGHGSARSNLESRAKRLGVWSQVEVAAAAARTLFSDAAELPEAHASSLQHCVLRSAREANGAQRSLRGVLSDTFLLAYSHWVKMPVHILVPHLARKTWLRLRPDSGGKA